VPGPTRRRLKICFIIGTLDRGGTEGQLVQLATRLDRERFETSVCCLSHDGPHRAALEAAGVPVSVVGLRQLRGLRSTLDAAGCLLRLVRIIRASGPDVVHGFLYWAYVFGAFAARLAGVPFVVASRRSLGYFKESRTLLLLLERIANSATDLLIANSEAVRRDVIRQERVSPAKIRVVYNGVQLSQPDEQRRRELRAQLNLADRGPVVAVVANFIAYKRHDILFSALPALVAEFPTLVLLMAGEGPLESHFEAHVRSSGLGETVRFLGARAEASDILSLADVAVHPSETEGFSNAVLEAMAAAKPIVAVRVGGNAEAIVEGETGLLVPVGDAAALGQAVLAVLRNPDAARAMGEAGRARVVRLFSIERMVAEYEQIYDEIGTRD